MEQSAGVRTKSDCETKPKQSSVGFYDISPASFTVALSTNVHKR